MDKNIVLKKMRDLVKLTLSADEQAILKTFTTPVKLTDLTSKDGLVILSFDGSTPTVGISVTVNNADGTPVAVSPDELEYIMSDGTTISVANGVISEVTTNEGVPTQVEPVDMNAVNKAIATAMEIHKKEFDKVNLELTNTKKVVVSLSKQLEEILDVEINNEPIKMSDAPKYVAPSVKALQRIKENEMNPKH